MANLDNNFVRYSDEDLEAFRVIVDEKLLLAQEQLDHLQEQILEISETANDDHGGDWVDDSAVSTDLEMLGNMASRQQKYIQDLLNAQLRIKNKTYGICVITGELIDKRRLMAVPTTTKSLTAKTDMRKKEEEKLTHRITDNPYVKEGTKEGEKEKEPKPKIITKVIRKNSPQKPVIPPISLDDDDEDDVDLLLADDLPSLPNLGKGAAGMEGEEEE